TGGILDIILQRLATYVEKAVRLRAAVKSALIYPVAVVSIAVLIVGALLKFVVPIFSNLFAGLGVTLPLPTRIVMGLSAFVQTFWWIVLVAGVGLVFGIKQIRKHPRGRYYFDKMLLYIPVIGSLLRKIAVGRFTRTLGTLITSGVPILEGLSITAKTSGNAVLEEALLKVRKAIEEGRTIVDPLRECGVFPNMVTQMIGVGEATGAMDSMLQKIADFYEEEVDAATRDMLARLVKVRILILTFLLGLELLVAHFTPTPLPLRLFIGTILLWYTLSLFYVVLLSFWQEHRLQASLQVLTDLALVSLVVHETGGW